ncbi:autotransporter outer membrane beta-barrel domain-containing protein [Variovorax guangxiensis]|uniref:Autotransporter outer membrane beta-barrel domain-containing protein n=1 Tax=Variovorax guangxiensis TaxID=1775474 RepID=A0A3S0Z0D1_9BURK|nr:autotransporter outer membrane beta-barrel domain-containing protein [Variovorax guangxiensis]RUR65865.1 autotransporter outer membrane beta-barrel domain-containing protein [Variovorax guangxiensis]
MNFCYRTVWNAALGAYVAAAENVRASHGGAGNSRSAVRVGTVLASAALFVSAAAQAATFTAGSEAELVSAVAGANASPDASSTITLTADFAYTQPLLTITKNVTVVPDGHVITASGQPFDVAAGASLVFQGAVTGTAGLVKNGDGALVLSGVTSNGGGNVTVNGGELRIQGGGSLTTGATRLVNATGDNSRIVVTGAGSKLTLGGGTVTIGSNAGSSLDVLDGGVMAPPTGIANILLIGDAAGTTGNLTIQGSGSLVTVSGTNSGAGLSNIRVLDGGRLNSSSVQLGGSGGAFTGGTSHVLVNGKNSIVFGANLTHYNGTVEVSDGGIIQGVSGLFLGRGAGGVTTGVVKGAGSSMLTTGGNISLGLEGEAILTVSEGGAVSARSGAGNIGMGQNASGSATLNIGAAVGDAPAAPGTVRAARILGGAGTAVVNFNHNASAYDFATPIEGSTNVNHIGSGTTTLTGANIYTGATNVAAGTLRAGAASALSSASNYTVTAGGTLDLNGHDQTIASMANGGTVSLVGSAPGTTLTVTGPWAGNGGTLRLGTALGDSSSASDRLVLSGATAIASGTTNVQITNLGGLGALTTGNGIEVVSAINGATTTAQTTKNAFALAGGHVDAGAYEYRLYAADASGAGENWYLRSSAVVTPPANGGGGGSTGGTGSGGSTGGGVSVPTYRTEVPLYAALPEQFRQANLSMLGSLHMRMGDNVRPAANDAGPAVAGQSYRQAWGRLISTDRTTSQTGTVSPTSRGRLTGVQAGTDLWADTHWRAGVYVGQLDGDMRVNGFASGLLDLGVGINDLKNQYFGVYGTWKNDSGLYIDGVLQGGRHRYTASPVLGLGSGGKGSSLLASVEVGQSFGIAAGWTIEPQLQLVHQRVNLDDTGIVGALIGQDSHDGWLVRAGVRVKGEIDTSAGLLQPYARLNLYHSGGGTDVARFIGPAGFADIGTRTGGSSGELALGTSWQLSRSTSLYGELGKLWDMSGDARNSSGVNASVGVKVLW